MDQTYKDELQGLGIDVNSAIERVMNNEDFYARLLGMFLDDDNFSKLKESVAAGDIKASFEAANALKGIVGNLGLNNLYEIVAPMTEVLRSGQITGIQDSVNQLEERYNAVVDVIKKHK